MLTNLLAIGILNNLGDRTVTTCDSTNSRNFSITDYISSYGYPIEVHENIETKDGYLLELHRIPHGKNFNSNKAKPVFLMHGLLGSSEDWILLGPEKSLAFLLADRGYDVWMGNARGNIHSRKHKELNPDKDSKFWQFSWHEIGIYDLPASINYILMLTKEKKLTYIGHSQGTTVFYVMAADVPTFNKYINVMISLAPVAFLTSVSITGNALLTTFFQSFFRNSFGSNNWYEIPPKDPCSDFLLYFTVCKSIEKEPDKNVAKLLRQVFPAGSSTGQVIHYIQGYLTGKFAHYNYGLFPNLIKYKHVLPPSYNLSHISTPVALLYAEKDITTTPKDVQKLASKLPNVVLNYLVPMKNFTHMDFAVSKNADTLVYSKIFEVMDEYVPS